MNKPSVHVIEITIQGPVVTGGLETPAHGLDTPFLRRHDGSIALPGTLLRGVLRQIFEAMSRACPDALPLEEVAEWFGMPSGNDSGDFSTPARWEPIRRQVHFDDLVPKHAPQAAPSSRTLVRIAVDPGTGSAIPGALQIVETAARIGEEITFCGELTIDQPADASRVLEWTEKALAFVPALGAHKTAGFGRVVGYSIREKDRSDDGNAAAVYCSDDVVDGCVAAGAAEVTLDFHDPFLVAAERWGGNAFRGSQTVPGATLKAVVASAINAETPGTDLYDSLGQAVFRHLKPAKSEHPRPRAIPLSLFAVDELTDDELRDALDEDPESWAEYEAVRFLPSWKQGDAPSQLAARTFGHTFVPTYDVRTRTAVSGTGVAETGQLFTMAAVRPENHVWKGKISRGSLDDPSFEKLLRALPPRLSRIGKTRASATLSLRVPSTAAQSFGQWANSPLRCRLVLESDAVLHAPLDAFKHPDRSPEERLELQYAEYFSSALASRAGPDEVPVESDALALKFFARQRRVGGYWAARYPPAGDGYYPWLLTCEGSVFELTVPPPLVAALQSFVTNGLPVPDGLCNPTWQGCPFVPENGYGEVRIDIVTSPDRGLAQ